LVAALARSCTKVVTIGEDQPATIDTSKWITSLGPLVLEITKTVQDFTKLAFGGFLKNYSFPKGDRLKMANPEHFMGRCLDERNVKFVTFDTNQMFQENTSMCHLCVT